MSDIYHHPLLHWSNDKTIVLFHLHSIPCQGMDASTSRCSEFERQEHLQSIFVSSPDLAMIESHRRRDVHDSSWLMVFGRYLKSIRTKDDPRLYPFVRDLLNENLPMDRALLLVLKQCVHLFPDQLHSLYFQRYLSTTLPTLTDPYLQYKYVRLLRSIVDKADAQSLIEILPSTSQLLEHHLRMDPALIIVLEKLVLLRGDAPLQSSLNALYTPSLIDYWKRHDFDDDEIIDLCLLLVQINRTPPLQCSLSNIDLLASLVAYIGHDADTMINWLLDPETGERFLLLILRLMKHLSAQPRDIESNIVITLKRFHDQLKHAHEKSLFPYNVKPLLNAFPPL